MIYDDFDNIYNVIDGNLIHSAGLSISKIFLIYIGGNGIQITAGAVVQNNIIVNCTGNGITGSTASVKSGSLPRRIYILHNTVMKSM